MNCAAHPNVETNLQCSKCEQPICPKCVVQTPVGARCRKCANSKKLPIYDVPKAFYVKAAIAGPASGILLGVIWNFIPFGGYLLFIIAAGVGYAIGEIISLSVNRKRGRILQVIAGVSMIVSYLVKSILLTPNTDFAKAIYDLSYGMPFGLIALIIGIVISVSRLR